MYINNYPDLQGRSRFHRKLDNVIEIRASKRSTEIQYAQIVRLVEEAQAHKAPVHRLTNRSAKVLREHEGLRQRNRRTSRINETGCPLVGRSVSRRR